MIAAEFVALGHDILTRPAPLLNVNGTFRNPKKRPRAPANAWETEILPARIANGRALRMGAGSSILVGTSSCPGTLGLIWDQGIPCFALQKLSVFPHG
jgi:hypothetical protein